MGLNIIKDPAYVQAVQHNKENAPDEVHQVIEEKLKGITSYFWGGAVRDPIFHVMYQTFPRTDDWDILADDSFQEKPLALDDLFEMEIQIGTASHNRYGTIKWIPCKGVEIDISRFSNANMIRNKETDERSLEISLASCDFNTGAIAYGFQNGIIYDGGALEGLKNKTLELHYGDDDPHVMMARLMMHTNDMGFTLGPRAFGLIKRRYIQKTCKKINGKIFDYLQRKGKLNRFKEITIRLAEISEIK